MQDVVRPEKVTAMLGMALPVVIKAPLIDMVSTGAPCVDQKHITPKNVTPCHDLLAIVTSIIPDEWELLLNNITPLNNFSDVPTSMHFGFDMGIKTPPTHTYTPPNHNSANFHPSHVLSHIRNELSLRRYSVPFSKSRLEYLIGPFRTSPLGTVPKSENSTECRIVQDLSFPRNDPTCASVNDQINIDNFRCDWGTFNDIRSIVIDAPTNAEAATLDVDAAFRCCPILPSRQRNFVIQWDDSFYIDHNAPFGATSSGSVFGRVADAMSTILTSMGLCPSKNWVDDFVFFRFPLPCNSFPPTYSYSLSDIYNVARRLGWPWKVSKTRPFAPEFKYIGFLWNLSTKSVQIPEDKKLRYLAKLEAWTPGQKFSKKDVESILGTLVHCSLAFPTGRSRLPSISRFASSFNHFSSPFIQRSPNPSILSDIDWWRSQLSAKFCGSILSRPPPISSIEFWVDASSSWGIGIVLGKEWDAWKLKNGWDTNGHNIRWAEITAIELGLLFGIHRGYSNTHFLIKSDNQGVIHVMEGGKSRSPEQNAVLQRITLLLSQYNLWISSLYVPSADNLADPLSHGLPAPNCVHASVISTINLPTMLQPFLVHVPVVVT